MPRHPDPNREAAETAGRERVPDAEPWENRRPPTDRPRHENAVSEDPDDPAETTAAIAAESWGEIVEVAAGDTVDGDFNGAPLLQRVEEASQAYGVDVLEAMEGAEAEALRESDEPIPEERLADLVTDRLEVLVERLDEAREAGLGATFEAVLADFGPGSGASPLIRDGDVLREQLARIDAALEQLESLGAARGATPR